MAKQDTFVSIIIVTYNGADYIIDCLRSLKEQTYDQKKVEIIAVDNNSADKTPEIIENTFRDVHIIRNKKNVGFGRANNIGIKKSKGQYILLLNQDSLVDKNWLAVLVKTMERYPDAGCCGAEEYSYSLYGKVKKAEKRVKECLWMGCGSVILRRKALDEAGLFDPYYFMYVEDIDLVWRIKAKGWKILQNYEALWFHKGKERVVDAFGKRLFWSWKNKLYLLVKFGGLVQIAKSLATYLHFFLRKGKKVKDEGKGTSKDGQEKQNRHKSSPLLEKLFFIIKLLATMPSLLVYALVARYGMRRKIRIKQQEIDALIAYTDKVFYNSE